MDNSTAHNHKKVDKPWQIHHNSMLLFENNKFKFKSANQAMTGKISYYKENLLSQFSETSIRFSGL